MTAPDGVTSQSDLTLYCAVPYIVACVDVSRMVFRDRSSSKFTGVVVYYVLCYLVTDTSPELFIKVYFHY